MTELEITCPNGCFEIEFTGQSREHLKEKAVKPDGPSPCPNCGTVSKWQWSE